MPRTTDLTYINTTTNSLSFLATLNDAITGRVNYTSLVDWISAELDLRYLFKRKTVTGTTTIGASTTGTLTLDGFKSYMISKVTTDYPSRVRIYADSTSSNIDYYRPYGQSTTLNSACFVDVLTTSGNLTAVIAPGIMGFNNDPSPNNNVYVLVTNNDSQTRNVTAGITLLQLER